MSVIFDKGADCYSKIFIDKSKTVFSIFEVSKKKCVVQLNIHFILKI